MEKIRRQMIKQYYLNYPLLGGGVPAGGGGR